MGLLIPLGLFFVIFDITTALTFSNSVLTLDSTKIKLSCLHNDTADYSLATRSAVECAKVCNKEALDNNCSRFNFFKAGYIAYKIFTIYYNIQSKQILVRESVIK